MKHYSVYTMDDRPLAIYATAKECARILGVRAATFYSYVMRINKGRYKPKKYQIFIDEED